MESYEEYYDVEDKIEEIIRKDLMGPITEDEILSETPIGYYSTGILWAQRTINEKTEKKDDNKEEDSTLLNDSEKNADIGVIDDLEDSLENPNGQINMANTYKPSTMAISAIIGSGESKVVVQFECAKYSHYEEEEFYDKKITDENGEESTEAKKRIVNKYKRYEINSGDIVFNTKNSKVQEPNNIPKNIKIELFVRKKYSDGSRLITVSVSNELQAQNKTIPQNTSALFQCHLSIISENGFLPITEIVNDEKDIEKQILNLLYRDVYNYATGHGCSVKWDIEKKAIKKVESEFIPTVELLQMKSGKFDEFDCLKMEFWKDNIRTKGCDELNGFINSYSEWMNKQKLEAGKIKGYETATDICLKNIEDCIRRLESGIEKLKSNDNAWKSFLYMNEAMLMQRVNYAKTKGKIEKESLVKWYPFQLAYILQIIPDIVDKDIDWRNVVDLLWFPTGGGKTEAYLGLCAFVIFYRRLTKGENGNGVTIIMRYTLRILTAQQFERATSLICACEYLRKKYLIMGEEISIGLWVGIDMTPNTIEKARENIKKIKTDEFVHKQNPIQIFHCPFCGQEITVGDYKIDTSMKIKCSNKECAFIDGLPIYVVDEDIYNKRPTMILSTIDKFARIVWEDKTIAIFGSDGNTPPPELIIQDELHLISGPLGSISGLYETAIDELCSHDGIKPKIIASTATVRNAESQIKSLYNRTSFQFPPSGINLGDSFFAIRVNKFEGPARRYIGLCETGGSLLDILIRLYGCMFFAIKYLELNGTDKKVIDQYFTIVGYFNSLKDLGSSSTVILDRVGIYSNYLRQHKFKDIFNGSEIDEIKIDSHNELTSRKSSKEIKDTLEGLEINYPDERAYSYILASNMLSVGIDVSRLGIMTVYSQPKTNAEYIQATSRVGRNNPGMVMQLYNAMRSRDKSHYEQFIYYHLTFYKHVEPTSVTPFSYRTIEKALHAIYIALIRHKIPELRDNADVVNYRKNLPAIMEIKEFILSRIKNIDSKSVDNANECLEQFEYFWEKAAIEKSESFHYALKNNIPETTYTLLVEAEKDNQTDFPSTLNALRNVDASSNVFILEREEENI